MEYESETYKKLTSTVEAHPSKAVQAVWKAFLGRTHEENIENQIRTDNDKGGRFRINIMLYHGIIKVLPPLLSLSLVSTSK